MKETWINGRWPLRLPDHRADRPEWPYWEATRLAAMYHHIRPGDMVYDVGAEAGDFPALFATWGAEVVLIEPNPKAWPTIKATFEGNSLTPVASVQHILTDEPPLSTFCHPSGWPAAADDPVEVGHGFHHIGQSDIPPSTLDAVVKVVGRDPDIVTMDVEGGEAHVIRGARETLETYKPTVFISIHPQFMADLYGEHPNEIHDTMKALGYHGRFLGEDHEQHWVFAHPEKRPFPGAAEEYYIPGDRIVL